MQVHVTYCIVIEFLFFLLTTYVACLQSFSGGILWPTSRRNRVVTQSCSNLHPSFRSTATVNRKCNDDGKWGLVDDSSCTAHNNAIPTLIISFKVNVSHSDAVAFAENVSLDVLVHIKWHYICTYVHRLHI